MRRKKSAKIEKRERINLDEREREKGRKREREREREGEGYIIYRIFTQHTEMVRNREKK